MSGPEIHALTGAYAADAVTGDERAAFERHLAECPACAQEVAELQATAARLGSAASAVAPPALRERVFAEVDQVRQQPPGWGTRAARPGPAWRSPLAVAAGLALVISLGSGTLAWREHGRADRVEQQAARVVDVLTDPDRRTVEARVSTGGTGTVVVADGRAVVVTRNLVELPEDRDYQLWVITGASPRPAGLLGGATTAERYLSDVPADATIGLTVEPAGGSRRPTTEPIMLADLSG